MSGKMSVMSNEHEGRLRKGGSIKKDEKKFYFILMKDSPAQKIVRTSVMNPRKEPTTALKGSLLYMTEQQKLSVNSPRSKTSEVSLASAENDDVVVRCDLQDIAQLSDIEYDLLLALTTCKERDALHQQERILRDAVRIIDDWRRQEAEDPSERQPIKIDIVDEKGHEDDMSGTLKYVGKLPGYNGCIFCIELDKPHRNVTRPATGVFNGKEYFLCQPNSSLVIAFNKIRISRTSPHYLRRQVHNISSHSSMISGTSSHSPPSGGESISWTQVTPLEGEASTPPPEWMERRHSTLLRELSHPNLLEIQVNRSPSSDPTASPLMDESDPNYPRDLRPDLQVGDRVVWISDYTGNELGTVRWIGVLVEFFSYFTIGVEFDNPVGSGTGQYGGQQLFSARQNHASLIPTMGLMKAEEFYGSNMLVPSPPSTPDVHAMRRALSLCVFNSPSFEQDVYQPQDDQPIVIEPFDRAETAVIAVNTTETDISTPHASCFDTNSMATIVPVDHHSPFLAPTDTRGRRDVIFSMDDDVIVRTRFNGTNEMELEIPRGQLPRPVSDPVIRERYTRTKTREEAKENREELEDMSNQMMALTASDLGIDVDIGSMVEVDIPTSAGSVVQYGVVRWMGCFVFDRSRPMVGVELEEESVAGTDGRFGQTRLFTCPPKRAFFTKLHRVRRDKRFAESSILIARSNSHAFGSVECHDIEGAYQSLSFADSRLLRSLLGPKRGIQGHHNSCYLDSTLFSMFAFSTVFDSLLYRPRRPSDIPRYTDIQQTLHHGIVNPLRCTLFVRADKVLRLRRLLDECGSVKGLVDEEKDPDEFLNSLLFETLKADPFLKLSSGQTCHFYQLFIEQSKESLINMPTTQQLLGLSFYQSDIRLVEVPSCLILQMPRFGRDYQMFRRIIPSLTLDITALLQRGPKPCYICGDLADVECRACIDVLNLEKSSICSSCSLTTHSNPKRVHHKPHTIPVHSGFLQHITEEKKLADHNTSEKGPSLEKSRRSDPSPPREILELFAIICIKTSHYVSFVKCASGPDAPWVFFDSMADRIGEEHGYNIPEIVECPYLPNWLVKEHREYITRIVDDKELPEQMRRVLCDAYICMYQSPELVHYL